MTSICVSPTNNSYYKGILNIYKPLFVSIQIQSQFVFILQIQAKNPVFLVFGIRLWMMLITTQSYKYYK